MERYFFIDFENVSDDGLAGFEKLSETDTVRLFYTPKSCRVSIETLRRFLETEQHTTIQFERVSAGPQALDMQLATYLGNVLKEDCEFYIISKDKGYAHIIQFWKERKPNVKILLEKSISECLETETSTADVSNNTDVEERAEIELSTPQKVETKPKAPPKKPKQNQAKQQSKTELNSQIQQALSKAGCDGTVISQTASLVVKNINAENSKAVIYKEIIKKHGQKKGLNIYNHIKELLK